MNVRAVVVLQVGVGRQDSIRSTLRGLQETRVATREESGVLGFPSRRGLTQSSREEKATDTENSGDMQRVPLENSREY